MTLHFVEAGYVVVLKMFLQAQLKQANLLEATTGPAMSEQAEHTMFL
jgi:hypothetical protein